MDLPTVLACCDPSKLAHAILCMVYYLLLDADQSTWEEVAGKVTQMLLALKDVCARLCTFSQSWRTYEPFTQCLHEALLGASTRLEPCLQSPVTQKKLKSLAPAGKPMERSGVIEILRGYHNDMSGYILRNPTFSEDRAQLSEMVHRFRECADLLTELYFFEPPLDRFVSEVQVLLRHGADSAQSAIAAINAAEIKARDAAARASRFHRWFGIILCFGCICGSLWCGFATSNLIFSWCSRQLPHTDAPLSFVEVCGAVMLFMNGSAKELRTTLISPYLCGQKDTLYSVVWCLWLGSWRWRWSSEVNLTINHPVYIYI